MFIPVANTSFILTLLLFLDLYAGSKQKLIKMVGTVNSFN